MAEIQDGTVTSTLPPGSDGNDVLTLHKMESVEELGRPFEIEATLLAVEDIDDQMESLLGTAMVLAVALPNDSKRYFHGLVSRLLYSGSQGERLRYQAVLRPWIWFLKHSSDNRVFQNKNVPDIIKEVFQDHGQSAKDSLTGTHEPREYCVQYGETDFDFVSRLMEEEGIYYYFEHSENKHELVLVDAESSHGTFSGYDEILYFPPGEDVAGRVDHINNWECLYQAESTTVVKKSYNYETASEVEGRSVISRSHDLSEGELYEYGTLYKEADLGEDAARIRVEEKQSTHKVLTGGGDVMGACAGCSFELKQAPVDAQNGKYLITSCKAEFQNNDLTVGAGGAGSSFSCSFKAIPENTPFRPARITPKGLVHGPQTALVVGPDGDTIYTDSLGRVKVQFHWDRLGEDNENSSCMVRVATAVAGTSWGMVAIPRIGQEVIVDFLEGDPDQPIIVGSVYNETNKPPYDLPDNMTQSGYKSRTTDGTEGMGDASTFNEIRFEDKLDEEEVFIQAEKNFKRVVKNNDELSVGLEKADEGNQTIEIQNDRTVTLHTGKDSLTVEDNDQVIDVARKISITAGDEFELVVGQARITLTADGTISMEGVKLEINTNAAVEVTSATIKLDGSGMVEVKAGGAAKIEGSGILDLKAGGAATLKGAVTMIG